MRVYKPQYIAKTGKRPTDQWYVRFKDHNDIWRKLRAFSDKAASGEFACEGRPCPTMATLEQFSPRVTDTAPRRQERQ